LPLTADARANLKKQLKDSVGDGQLLERLMKQIDILRDEAPDWADWVSWKSYIDAAKEPSPHALAQYLAKLACTDSRTAEGLGRRAKSYGYMDSNYAEPLAEALLNLSCEGEKGLTEHTRAMLQRLARP
jgi:hypothetical protein